MATSDHISRFRVTTRLWACETVMRSRQTPGISWNRAGSPHQRPDIADHSAAHDTNEPGSHLRAALTDQNVNHQAPEHGWHRPENGLSTNSEAPHEITLDAAHYLDFSTLPLHGIDVGALPKILSLNAGHLPSFDSVIDLRHDLLVDLSKHQNAGGDGPDFRHEAHFAGNETPFAGSGSVDFVHNLANDLEAAMQNHDAR